MSALGNSLRRRLALGSKADFFIEEISGSNITQSDIEGWLGGYAVIGFENNNGIIRFRLRQIGTPTETTDFNNIHLKLKNVTILNSSYLFPQRYAVPFTGSVNSVFTLQENLSSLGLSFRSASNLRFYFSNQVNIIPFVSSFQGTSNNKIIIFNKLTQLSNGDSFQHRALNCRYFSANKAVLLENQQGLELSGETFITRGEYENTPSGVNQQLDYIRNQFNNIIYAQNYTLPSPPTNIQTTQVGGTYIELDQTSFPAHVNDYLGVLVFEDDFFFGFFENSLLFALTPETSYNFKIRLVDEFFNISEPARFNVSTPALPALFQNAVAYFKLDETSGNAIDVINGNVGQVFGGVTQGVAGKIGTAYSFDGIDGYLSVNESFDFIQNTLVFTINVWVKINDLNKRGAILGSNASAVNKGFSLFFENNVGAGNRAIRFVGYKGVSGQTVISKISNDNAINDNDFHLVSIVGIGNDVKIYVDNTETAYNTSSSFASPFSSLSTGASGNPTFIGAVHNNGSALLNNDLVLDEININDSSFTTAQLSDLYNNGNGTTI